jgi:hypothetical protein
MSNNIPIAPNLNCPVPLAESDNYFTTQQSQLNFTRQDKFQLVMDIPNILKPLLKKENRVCNGGNLERLQMSIWGFVVPEIKINVADKPYNGQVLKFSGLSRPAYPNVNIRFTVDNKFDNYFILYKWLDIQNDDVRSTFDGKTLDIQSKGLLHDYSSTFSIYSLDEYNNPTARWDYYNAFPISIGSIEASYRETKELECNFSFEFNQLKMHLL